MPYITTATKSEQSKQTQKISKEKEMIVAALKSAFGYYFLKWHQSETNELLSFMTWT